MKQFTLYAGSTTIVVLLFIGLSMITTSCHPPFDNKVILLKVDTLQQLVNAIDNELVLNEDTLNKRNDSMKIKLAAIHTLYKDTTDGEVKASITRYQGIHANYEDFLKSYPLMVFDEDKHKKSVGEFKEKVLSGKISQAEFDQTYRTEKEQLSALLTKAKTITYNTVTIEEDYQRHDPVVTKLYKNLVRLKK